jgi:uncharacterized protein
MNDILTRQRVSGFLDAFYDGDADRLAACCHDDVDSITYAPIGLFPHLGHKRGKAWVAEAIRIQQQRYASRRFDLKFIAVDGDKAASMVSVALEKRSDQRIVQFEVADFFTLRDGLVAEHRAFFDSFDVVQQVLGKDLTGEFAADIRSALATT